MPNWRGPHAGDSLPPGARLINSVQKGEPVDRRVQSTSEASTAMRIASEVWFAPIFISMLAR